ncbi:MAG: hypothetical protein BRC44_02650 [Cyanobacteria bacterium QS_4_48_99]|nr:MAG: hypothetical protein BRC44_02650 [Cyanobacteria bacterium QS_4_48_99]
MFETIWKIQSSSLMSLPRQLSFSFRSLVAREPALWILYQPYLWWGQMKRKTYYGDVEEGIVTPDTELVIDGFQGSANSFAVAEFKRSQTRHVKLLHHRHAPVAIIRAIEQGIPVLLTIREPLDTVISLTSRWPHVSANQALKSYIGFYTKLKPYAPYYVVSTFEQTTQHLDRVVQVVNAKFSTNFDLVDSATVNEESRVKARNPEKARRDALKQDKMKELAAAKNAQLLAKANELYRTFEAFAQQTMKP